MTSDKYILSPVFNVTGYGIWDTLHWKKQYKKYSYNDFALLVAEVIVECIYHNSVKSNLG